jgi:hypothetical protein
VRWSRCLTGHYRCATWGPETERWLAKITPLAGVLFANRVRCGKAACQCTRGQLLGPYWYRRWREGRRQRRRYVKPGEFERVRAGVAEWARLHPPAYRLRQELALLRRLLRELDGED